MRILLITFFLTSSICFSQHKILLKGHVFVENAPYNNVNVKNTSFGIIGINSDVTDEFGNFNIAAKLGDTLLFSSIDLDYLSVVIKYENILVSDVKVEMSKKKYKLQEVIINKTNKINAVSLGIIPKAIKTKTPIERRLYTAGEFKPIQLLNIFGGSLQLDPIFNAINGKTNKLKKELLIEKNKMYIKFLKNNYQDYVLKTLKIPEEELLKFYYFIEDQDDVQKSINSKDDLKIKFFLCNQLINYQNTYLKVEK